MESTNNTFLSTRELVERALARINHRFDNRNERPAISWGFDQLDQMTGGIQKSTVAIIGGRPAMGKTAFAINSAIDISLRQQKSVAFVTTEASASHTMQRMLTTIGKVDANRLRTASMKADDWKNLFFESARLREAPLFLRDRCTTFLQVAEVCRQLKKQPEGLDVVFIDDLQSMTQGEVHTVRPEERSPIVSRLKSLACELDVAIIITANLSAILEQRVDKRPVLADLRGGTGVSDKADVVLMIYREEYYEPETEEKCLAEIIVRRQEDGPVGTIELFFNAATSTFSNMEVSLTETEET